VATMVSDRRSTFGINCIRCNDELIAPEKSEYHDGKFIRHLWLCSKCKTRFESFESIPCRRYRSSPAHRIVQRTGNEADPAVETRSVIDVSLGLRTESTLEGRAGKLGLE
jgi:hypothetical protein